MIREVIIGVICTIISSILTIAITKLFLGYKNLHGIRKTARFHKDCYTSGIINVFPDRKAYIQHKDHGKSNEYISRASHSVLYVGYWLATSIELGEITSTVKSLIDKQITVTLVFLAPNDKSCLEICSKYIAVEPIEIQERIETALKRILEFKKTLDSDQSKFLVVKTHNVPLSTTAFVIDYAYDNQCKVLLDYKIFNGTRESSYGIEYQNSKKTITSKILKSYISVSKSAIEINNMEDIK